MGFKTLATLDADKIIALGGKDKKSGKKNPTSVEGYYLGSRKVPSTKAKSGFAYIHYFQESTGNVGVWGKTNMDRQLLSVAPGTMTRVSHTGMKDTKNGPMYVYKVEVDVEQTIDVGDLAASEESYEASSNEDNDDGGDSDAELEKEAEEEQEAEEETKLPARAASASTQSEVNAILRRRSANR